jgi:hypothetical protein
METNFLDLSKRKFLCFGAAALASLKLINLGARPMPWEKNKMLPS